MHKFSYFAGTLAFAAVLAFVPLTPSAEEPARAARPGIALGPGPRAMSDMRLAAATGTCRTYCVKWEKCIRGTQRRCCVQWGSYCVGGHY